MNEQLLPLLLEHTAGKRSNEILKNITEQDQNNQQLSIRLVQDQLQLFDEAMQLQLDALAFAAEYVTQWSEADQVIVAMACRAFNHLKSAAYLLLMGYWAECWPLMRGAFEAMTREIVFFRHPDRVSRWLKGQQAGQVAQSEVSEAIKSIYGEETFNAHKGFYKLLCKHVHPNREAIELATWNGTEGIGRRSILGGCIHINEFPFRFHTVLLMSLQATKALGLVGLHEATDTWKQQSEKLEKDVYAIADKLKRVSSANIK
jgi:hypothetical protein